MKYSNFILKIISILLIVNSIIANKTEIKAILDLELNTLTYNGKTYSLTDQNCNLSLLQESIYTFKIKFISVF